MRSIILAVLVLLASCSACRHEYIDPVTHEVIDCTKQDAGQIGALIATFATTLIAQGDVGKAWDAIEQLALDAGKNIGGCALAAFTHGLLAPQPGIRAPAPEQTLEAREALNNFRANFSGAPVWQVADGQAL